jgi:hypothetical protein
MCTAYNKGITNDLITQFNNNNGVLDLWKVYRVVEKSLLSPFNSKKSGGRIRGAGIKKSSKKDNFFNSIFNDSILEGFHVCIDEKSAKRFYYSTDIEYGKKIIIIKVKVKKEDLIGAGYWRPFLIDWDTKNAVFTKLEITKEEWKKIKFPKK